MPEETKPRRPGRPRTGVPRRLPTSFSIEPDVLEQLNATFDQGERSLFVNNLLRYALRHKANGGAAFWDEDPTREPPKDPPK